ncbi:MAG: peptide-methionine (R)-S-oxide reductase [Hyphomicrobiales bacterium]|nr:MAG: peptide-methionine (R)-S-oxide reductase [Hyphomicrobiales bacterium]
MTKIEKTDDEWRKLLTAEQYHVTRDHGTEPPFKGPHQEEKRPGDFNCVCCGNKLFRTDAKFDSGTGWPSYFQPASPGAVSEHKDRSMLIFVRTEIRCADCDAHLGHVFDDGPEPTGLRYCMNGHAFDFKPDE